MNISIHKHPPSQQTRTVLKSFAKSNNLYLSLRYQQTDSDEHFGMLK